jgi:hypothetical protein
MVFVEDESSDDNDDGARGQHGAGDNGVNTTSEPTSSDDDDDDEEEEPSAIFAVASVREIMPATSGSDGNIGGSGSTVLAGRLWQRLPPRPRKKTRKSRHPRTAGAGHGRHNNHNRSAPRDVVDTPVIHLPSGLMLPGPAFASILNPISGFAPRDVAKYVREAAAPFDAGGGGRGNHHHHSSSSSVAPSSAASASSGSREKRAVYAATDAAMMKRSRRASEGKRGSMLALAAELPSPSSPPGDSTTLTAAAAAAAFSSSSSPARDASDATAADLDTLSPETPSSGSKDIPTAASNPQQGGDSELTPADVDDDPGSRKLATTLLREVTPAQANAAVQILTVATEWNVDVFSLAECTGGRPLAFMLSELMTRIGAFAIQGISPHAFLAFVDCLEREYSFDPSRPNPYHCSTHAADVAQACGHLLVCEASRGGPALLDQADAFALVLAAAIHDFRHPGVSNLYLHKTAHPLALRYNDDSVLENYHVAEAFTAMRRPGMEVLTTLARPERDEARRLMIQCVRATDLSKGGALISKFSTGLERCRMDEAQSMDRGLVCEMIIKCSDVSHPARLLPQPMRWSDLITTEFFAQGDEEARLGMPKSPLCDRASADLPKGQLGFIQFVVRPAMKMLTDWLGAAHITKQMDDNEAYWRRKSQEAK